MSLTSRAGMVYVVQRPEGRLVAFRVASGLAQPTFQDCACVRVRACVRACVYVCVCACARAHMCACERDSVFEALRAGPSPPSRTVSRKHACLRVEGADMAARVTFHHGFFPWPNLSIVVIYWCYLLVLSARVTFHHVQHMQNMVNCVRVLLFSGCLGRVTAALTTAAASRGTPYDGLMIDYFVDYRYNWQAIQ